MTAANPKYEILGNDTKIVGAHKLYRVRALSDFGNVKAGTLGGYIESEKNLSQEGNCWVGDSCLVFGNANVSQNATLKDRVFMFGNAKAYGNANLMGAAKMCDDARAFGDVILAGNAQAYGNTRISMRATLNDHARAYGFSMIQDDAYLGGTARVGGDQVIDGNTIMLGDLDQDADAETQLRLLTGAHESLAQLNELFGRTDNSQYFSEQELEDSQSLSMR